MSKLYVTVTRHETKKTQENNAHRKTIVKRKTMREAMVGDAEWIRTELS